MRNIFIKTIDFYQLFISFDKGILRVFTLGGACKFTPTCSEYTKDSILKYGIIKGGMLGLKRIISCNPWTN